LQDALHLGRVVIDHFGGARAEGGTGQPGFAELLALVGDGHVYVKVSAAYRSSDLAPDYGDVAPLARALITANPDRIVWGTDSRIRPCVVARESSQRDRPAVRHR
jgi:predicted TIM-barrel fold metal-dependent hydrolase